MEEQLDEDFEEQTNEFAINTCNVLYLLKAQCNDFPIEQLVEFRERLENALIINKKVHSVFHPLRWRFFRQKYLDSLGKKWKKVGENNKIQMFSQGFFMENSYFLKRISIDTLSDDEKIQIVAPLRENTSIEEQRPSIRTNIATETDILQNISPLQNITLIKIKRETAFELFKVIKSHRTLIFEDLSPEERQEILDKICPPKTPISTNDINGLHTSLGSITGNRKLINSYNDNDPYDWSRWEYDLYLIDVSCELNKDKDREDFEYFFAWQLALTDLYGIKPFLNWHFTNTFYGKANDFKEFIEILLLKYEKMQFDRNIKEIANRYLASIDDIPNLQKIVIEKNSKKQKLEIPIKVTRKFGDDFTCLTVAQTAILFEYLSESSAILSHEKQREFLAKENKSKAIQILSGYGYGGISDAIEANVKKKDKREVREVKKIIEKIKLLIDNDLI